MLSKGDKEDIREILKPIGDAAKSQAKSIEKQAEHLGKMSERMARVEEKVVATKETMDAQIDSCNNIHGDLYGKVNPITVEVATVRGVANEANDRSKWLRVVLVGLLVSVALLGIKITWDLVSSLSAAQ